MDVDEGVVTDLPSPPLRAGHARAGSGRLGDRSTGELAVEAGERDVAHRCEDDVRDTAGAGGEDVQADEDEDEEEKPSA